MSTQVYSNFEQRKLYRGPQEVNRQSIINDIVIPSNFDAIEINAFRALSFPNANYSYDPLTRRLTFTTEGVYCIGLTTAWTLTNSVSTTRCLQYMLLNEFAEPKFGACSMHGYLATTDTVANLLSSNETLKLKIGDQITFWVSGLNGGTQTLKNETSSYRTEFFVTKLS